MLKGPIALGTIRTSFVLGLRLFIQAGTLLLVARMLGPEEFGAFAGIASLAVLLGALSTFGTNLILFGEISKESTKRNLVLSYAIPTTFLCGGLLFAIYLIMAFWLLPSNSLPWQALLAIGFAEVLLQPLFGLMSVEHHAFGRIARAQLMQNSPLVLRLFSAAIIFFLDLTPAIDIYAGSYLVASILALLLAAFYLPERWPGWHRWRLPKVAEWRQAFGYAAINISKVGPAELDKTLAMKLLSLEAAGIYAAGARVVGAITLPVTAMTLSALPRLFRESGGSEVSSRNLLRWMYVAAFTYGLILAGALWLAAPVLEIVFGKKYQGMCEVIRWLCLAVPGITLRLVAGNALMASKSPWKRFAFEVVGLLLLVIFSVAFVSTKGVKGMPLALVVAEWGMAIVGFILLKNLKVKES
jgi:O-antigen/teichoic acid export membrane protein